MLLGVGKDAHGRNAVILWSTAAVVGGEVRVMAKAHTDVAIAKMKFAPFDHSRYPHTHPTVIHTLATELFVPICHPYFTTCRMII